MASYFDDLVRTHLDPHVDRHFGSLVTVLPRTRGPNGRSQSDRDRPVLEVVGILTSRSGEAGVPHGARAAGGRQANALRNIASSFESTLTIASAAFPSTELHPRQGDLAETGGYRHEIVGAQLDGSGRIVCHLVRLGPI